jgi:uncharacterized protein YcsI (UPF0317 family)
MVLVLMNRPLDTQCSQDLRALFRRGNYTGHTAGFAPGFLQCNLVILSIDDAADFLRYCQLNPRPCPLLWVGTPGCPHPLEFGADIDLRTDLPAYDIHRDGRKTETVRDIRALWHDDLVAFLLGCSLTFDDALTNAGVQLRHIGAGGNLSAYITTIETIPTSGFGGPMVVTLRPLAPDDAEVAERITSGLPHAHGAPVHRGNPADIGIADIMKPDWGAVPDIRPGDECLFWACGVTSQIALQHARPSLCITHNPGSMLITDIQVAQSTALEFPLTPILRNDLQPPVDTGI